MNGRVPKVNEVVWCAGYMWRVMGIEYCRQHQAQIAMLARIDPKRKITITAGIPLDHFTKPKETQYES